MWILSSASLGFKMKKFYLAALISFLSLPLFGQPAIKTRVTTTWTDSASPKVSVEPAATLPTPKSAEAPKPETKPTRAKLYQYRVQVGAFSSEENALRLQERMKSAGFMAQIHISKDLDRRIWYHVLIGDHKDQKSALKQAAEYVDKYNMKAVVLDENKTLRVFNPEAELVLKEKVPEVYGPPGVMDPELIEPPQTIYTPAVEPDKKFTFQVGGLYRLKPAQELVQTLRKRGYRPIITKRQDANALEWWYSVEIGFFYTKTDAEYAASAFFDKEHIQAIVPNPQIKPSPSERKPE